MRYRVVLSLMCALHMWTTEWHTHTHTHTHTHACIHTCMYTYISRYGAVSSVRFARDRQSGEFRGLAFIDMATLEEAQAVISMTHGQIPLLGQGTRVEYSREGGRNAGGVPGAVAGGGGGGGGGGVGRAADWLCAQCSTVNFARRDVCFTCSSAREGNELPVPSAPARSLAPAAAALGAAAIAAATSMTIEEVPSSILLIRDLSANVTDYHVYQVYCIPN